MNSLRPGWLLALCDWLDNEGEQPIDDLRHGSRITLDVAIAQAVDQRDSALAGAIVDRLRGAGFTYAKILEKVRTVRPGVTASDWEDLMYEADEQESKG
jgi:preprotein translocase subunit SecD